MSGFDLVRTTRLKNLDSVLHELVHTRTGARHVHFECDDDNNAFSAIFMTVPKDSTGVAHILEHVVLGGSKHFPVPAFFSMITRSLSTFMNAMTSADRTQYPFSTRNLKDYNNLLDVYLDAAFLPLLEEDTFKQEGHRLEFEKPDDPTSGLRFKGVVFNEMKSGLSSPGGAMGRALSATLFHGLTYSNWSGGDPERIPDLTWQQLRDFHAAHYHPSNARFFTYGNFPLQPILDRINERVLQHFERREVDVSIPDVERFSEPRKAVARYPIAEGEDPKHKGQALVAWVTSPVTDSYQTLVMRVLADTLLANSGSPLRKALIESGLGSTVADGTGFGPGGSRESVFGAGLKDIDPTDAGKVEELVLSTLSDLAKNGLDKEQVEAAIHQIELGRKERSNSPFGYALRMMFTVGPPYVYGADIAAALDLDTELERLRQDVSDGALETMIREQLIENMHRVTVVGEPDLNIQRERSEREAARLAKIEAALTDEDKARIVTDSKRLRARQDDKGDLSVLPTLGPADIVVKISDAEGRIDRFNGGLLEFYPQPTGGLSYAVVRGDIAGLDDDVLAHLGLFSYVLTRSGAGDLDHTSMAARIAAVTGGVGAAVAVQNRADEGFFGNVQISGNALARNQNDLLSILSDFASSARFETSRLKELVQEHATQLKSSLPGLSMNYVQQLARGYFSPAAAMRERISGPSHLRLVKRLADLETEGLDELAKMMERVRAAIFQAARTQVCLTASDADLEEMRKFSEQLLGELPQGSADGELPSATLKTRTQALTAPVAIATNLMAFPTVAYTHPDAPIFPVLARYLWATYLHREIREKGGAYTSAAMADTAAGTFSFLSGSDPNITRTYDVWKAVPSIMSERPVRDEDLKEAILTACKDLDPLESPDMKGRRTSSQRRAGFTPELRESFWRRSLEVTADDLVRVTSEYLTSDKAAWATVAGADAVETANKDGLFEIVEPLI